ncbi:TPA: hypothetical protein R4142_001568 [Citrobacter freundii]|nr:hypothetical protein [Citrobacter freundii]HED3520364.1 hypothetical protein [Citrobacter freundii]HED3525669.1 hypothetical protein [Citrobacter freundii]HED3594112.1 hypothetical protein [Citrobacter freundii]
MLASELINILQEAIDKNGDLDVLIKDEGYFSCQSECGTYYPPFTVPVVMDLDGDFVIHVTPSTESVLDETKSGPALIIGKTVDGP